jgi:DNA-binding LacI/PurR family transcriptional regulator
VTTGNFDTEVAARLVVDHLVSKGHRRIAFVNPKPGQSQFEKLKTAFLAHAPRRSAVPSLLESDPAEKLIWPLPATTLQDKVNVLVERWARQPAATRPTALFVPSDRTVVQLYSALDRRQLRVGVDVSVVSCNNEQSLLMDLHPAPTTIDVHAESIGRRAVDQLRWRISHPDDPLPTQVLLEPTLVERDSVATL